MEIKITHISINKEYQLSKLLQVDDNPFTQFEKWFQEACAVMPLHLSNAMTLATLSKDLQPSARVVLLKEFNTDGFVFYTNYLSKKGREIIENPKVALLFWWEALERQVRIEGIAKKIDAEHSDFYFASRPKTSQIAATISQQSQELVNVEFLQTTYESVAKQYTDAETQVPRPEHWGGYVVIPRAFEYWQGRENRLHDRFQYNLLPSGKWKITRLFP